MEKKIKLLLEEVVQKGKRFDDENNGISIYMVEDIFYIKDIGDKQSSENNIVNNYFLSLNKQKIRNIKEQVKKEILLNEMVAILKIYNFDIIEFIDFLRKMKPVGINNSITCHRIIS
jgi:hypothetical protein